MFKQLIKLQLQFLFENIFRRVEYNKIYLLFQEI